MQRVNQGLELFQFIQHNFYRRPAMSQVLGIWWYTYISSWLTRDEAGQVGQGDTCASGHPRAAPTYQVLKRSSCQGTLVSSICMLYPGRSWFCLSCDAKHWKACLCWLWPHQSTASRNQWFYKGSSPSLKAVALKTFCALFPLFCTCSERMPVKLDLGLLQS